MTHLWAVMLGSFLGAVGRYALTRWLNNSARRIPAGTLAVNLAGCFGLGWLAGSGMTGSGAILWGVGLLGSLTTFSTLQLEQIKLMQNKAWITLAGYTLASYGGGLFCAWIGFIIGQSPG